ncbi:MAG: glutamate synthase subunit beta [Candidatus Omnitrophica bacterium]|nr:glutamate synthase subunit beta [Candidatus Omnitrophota bacterium]
MGDIKGFMTYSREDLLKEPAQIRKQHWGEFIKLPDEKILCQQGARCMNCGVPFCHWGCPLANVVPELNDLVFNGRWQEAVEYLLSTNNFPEFTGRLCPALCENSCVMAINQPAVTIRNIELAIIERAYDEGWITPQPPWQRTGKTVAVIGSGPAGLACADELNKLGHTVTVFEKNETIGGILALGIPDFKLEKSIIARRIDRMEKEGVQFKTKINVGTDISVKKLRKEYSAVVLAGGAEQARGLTVPGAELEGVYQAMTYLAQQNRINRGERMDLKKRITAKGKNVIVLGGGDTGSDCVGTANRQGAKSVKQFEILPKPPQERDMDNPWPQWASIYRKSTSQEEGAEQDFCVLTKRLSGKDGTLKKLHAVRVEYGPKDPATGRRPMKEILGSDFEVDCDLLILAMGFLGPVKKGMLEESSVALDERGNVKTNTNYMTSVDGVFSAGDMRRGQSLVVWAIDEGRKAAQGVHQWLSE